MTVQYGGLATIAAVPLYGTAANRPSAATSPDGLEYFATDTAGGTLYQVQSGSWVTLAPGVTLAPQSHGASHEPGGTDDLYMQSGNYPANRVWTFAPFNTSENFGPSNGNMYLSYLTAPYTLTVSNLYMMQWSTAAATYTLMRFGIWTVAANGNVTLVAATNDLHSSGANQVNGSSNVGAFSTNAALLYQLPLSLAGDLTTSQTTYQLVRGTRYAFGLILYSSGAPTIPLVLEPQSSNAHGAVYFSGTPRMSAVRTGQTELGNATNAQLAATGRFPWLAAD